jgi:large subunit ribosomal protein L4
VALSYLNKEGRLFVVESIKSEGKSGELAKRLKQFGCKKAVLVDSSLDEKVKRASRNLVSYKYFPVAGLNVFDILKMDHLILSKESVSKIVERCKVD